MSHYNNPNVNSASAAYIHKPENALRRAAELQSISQPTAALTLLHDVLSSRRHRTWSPTYEKIMILYLDLCLEKNKAREAKDGLHQYRNLSQSQAPGSLEVVIRYLIDKAEEKCRLAKEEATDTISNNNANEDVLGDDEEEEENGEPGGTIGSNILLLSTMSADPAQTQRDSTLLLPKLKFLWEAYRAVLDILKSNSRLERLYHSIATGALKFCGGYKRRTEFRRLCDMLRMHLGNLQKYGGAVAMAGAEVDGGKPNSKVRGWEGWTTESIELHLQTRFAQLETASTLHLYTEGFRTVEDIYNILQISHSRRKIAASNSAVPPPPKAKLMAAYYEKLTTLFWVSENYLFHAFAWYKFYTLCREYNRGMTQEQKTLQASAVLLSALCIPTSLDESTNGVPGKERKSNDAYNAMSSTIQDDIAKEKTARMATLLGFHTRNPTKEALLSEIRAKNVMADVPFYLRDLYKLLEENSNPLVLVERAKPLLERLRSEVGASLQGEDEEKKEDLGEEEGTLSRYVQPLTSVLLLKLLHALSASYHTISLDHIKSLTSGLGVSFTQVEKAIVSAATSEGRASLVVRIDHRANCLRFGDAAAGSQLESDTMRSQLTTLAKQLSVVCSIISPTNSTSSFLVARRDLYEAVRSNLQAEHESMLARKDMIEKQKEEVERLAQDKIREEARIKMEREAEAKAEEERRLAREQRLREKEKLAKIQKEMESIEKKRYLEALGRSTEGMAEKELLAIDTAALAKEHADKAAKKKDDAERKVKETQKRLDYIVRATRIEEMPLIKARYEERVNAERERYEADVVEKARNAKLQWEADRKEKSVLDLHNVFQCMEAFQTNAMAGRRIVHDELCKEEDRRAEIEAEKAKLQRARQRKDDAIRLAKEEEEKKKKEVEERKAEEERARREVEKRRKEEEEEERRRKETERMAAERERDLKAREAKVPPPPPSRELEAAAARSSVGGAGDKYVPPSLRNRISAGAGAGGDRRFGGGGSGGLGDRAGGYGGGRYDGGGRDRYPGGSSSGEGDRRFGGSSGGGGSGGLSDRGGGRDRYAGGDGHQGGSGGGGLGDRGGGRDRYAGGDGHQGGSGGEGRGAREPFGSGASGRFKRDGPDASRDGPGSRGVPSEPRNSRWAS